MKLKKRIELARVGNWNDIPVTADMLLEMQSNFQPVPIRPGHVPIEKGAKTDGFISAVYFDNNSLLGDIELSEQLADDYNNKKYISWSIDCGKYSNGWNLTALALLGAEKPAIKGLRELQFSEDNQTLNIKFTEEERDMLTPEEIKAIAKGIIDAMGEERLSAKKEIDEKYKEIDELRQKSDVIFAENEDLKKKLSEKETEVAEFSEKEKTAAEKLKANHNAAVEEKAKEIAEFSEVEAGKFKELFFNKPENAVFMENYTVKGDTRASSRSDQALTFSEKTEKPVSITEARINKNKARG
jgi:hypothetical protein